MTGHPTAQESRRLSSGMVLGMALLVSGCNFNLGDVLERLSGRERNLVVLTKQPFVIVSGVSILSSRDAMTVLGEHTFVCFALRGDVPVQDAGAMQRAFDAEMHGAKVKVELVLTNGERVALRQPMQAWSKYGKIFKSDELSACATTPCKAKLPQGAVVNSIEVSAQPPVTVHGVYWQSEKAPNEKPVVAPVVEASVPNSKTSSCN
jgi:hypothetical protein